MTPIRGTDIMLYVNTGTVAAPVWTAVCSSTGHTLNINTELLEARTKCDGDWRRLLPGGIRNWSVDFDALDTSGQTFTPHDLIAWQLENRQFMVRLRSNATGSTGYQGTVMIESSSLSAPVDGWSSFNLSVQGTGALTQFVVAP